MFEVCHLWHTSDALLGEGVPSFLSWTNSVEDISASMTCCKKLEETIQFVCVEDVYYEEGGKREQEEGVWSVCTLCLASMHVPENSWHIHVHVHDSSGLA